MNEKTKPPHNCWSCMHFIENPWTDENCVGICNRNCDVAFIHRNEDLEEKDC